MLASLLSRMDRDHFEAEVVSLANKGAIGPRIESLGIPVRALGMERGKPSFAGLLRLIRALRETRPDVIQTWMYHANLAGGIATKFGGGGPVVWGVHAGHLESGSTKRHTRWIIRLTAMFSGWLPARIVYCSRTSYNTHMTLGYSPDITVVIPNGFDTSKFAPDAGAGTRLREELNLGEDTLLIGMVARFDPQKDHKGLFQAAALLYDKIPDVHFVLCGEGITQENEQLMVLRRFKWNRRGFRAGRRSGRSW